jgi:hypothetical protein
MDDGGTAEAAGAAADLSVLDGATALTDRSVGLVHALTWLQH